MLDFGFYNMDCIEGMKQFPDKYFDLAVVDPPYGIGYDVQAAKNGGTQSVNGASKKKEYHASNWDQSIPSELYFQEVFRVSKQQIFWGGNYFTEFLPPSKCWLVWDKQHTSERSFADIELAWASFDKVARIFHFMWDGFIQGDMSNKENRIHPTQKPVALYKWILKNYAKKGDKILDTHVGSASSLIACHRMKMKYVGFEIDPVYYAEAKERLKRETAQVDIFDLL